MSDAILVTVGTALNMVLNALQLLVFVSVMINWVGGDPRNPIVTFIERVTEPIYRPFRRITRNWSGPFDWAPFIVLVLIISIQRGFVVQMMRAGSGFDHP